MSFTQLKISWYDTGAESLLPTNAPVALVVLPATHAARDIPDSIAGLPVATISLLPDQHVQLRVNGRQYHVPLGQLCRVSRYAILVQDDAELTRAVDELVRTGRDEFSPELRLTLATPAGTRRRQVRLGGPAPTVHITRNE
jgi:hypothetical protein